MATVAVRVLSAYAAGEDPVDADIAQLLAVGVLEAPVLAQAVLDAEARFVRVRVIALAASVVQHGVTEGSVARPA